ncbi:hypothetical protein [Curtobacterium sp. MCBD17_019]|uniref:hypothetical protein n=1 Tax=Curtobacterium sp. MCBD17_019 TaxID=2175669 RepID=UPI000DA7629C|nr:hypothetical protein [Curtobacterium sp. MCBD17_019]PZE73439.1 hypothetical protein DEI82_14380 [Curtobacterium sp. MCBD17_019]
MDTGQAWANALITLLTVAAFILSSLGLYLVHRDAAAAVQRMEHDRDLRNRLRDEYHHALAAANSPRAREAASVHWRSAHEEAGLEPYTRDSIGEGREYLAERIIRELSAGSRLDFVLVGIGLLCGLAASVWSIWLP